MQMRTSKRYGWTPDLPDSRDLRFSIPRHLAKALPPTVDLINGCPPVYDQINIGSCTANAIAAAHQFDQLRQKQNPVFMPSRLFIYYNEREMEGTIDVDAGAQIRDGVKAVDKLGVCSEGDWAYTPTERFLMRPTKSCYASALKHQALCYRKVDQTLDDMRGCLASGFPFIFGFSVYSSFEGPEVVRTGKLNVPKKGEALVGGHAVLCIGYSDVTQRFKVRNSWGPGWGINGYFTMPYSYLINSDLAADMWQITTVE
jgi:C1A family cysteine protease